MHSSQTELHPDIIPCFHRSEAQGKPNHGFRILDSQLSMRFIFPLAYADIFLIISKSGEETHAPQSPLRPFNPSKEKIDNLTNQIIPSDSEGIRTLGLLRDRQAL